MVMALKVITALPMLIRVGLLSLILMISGCAGDWNDLWLTSDQQAQRLADSGDHAAAAQLFSDPMRSGTQWYRAGEFERAAAEFGRLEAADAYFNRGNALVFQGKYEDAIQVYERALQMQPNWPEAEENRQLAQVRKARLERPEDDAGGTGGMLEADEIVFLANFSMALPPPTVPRIFIAGQFRARRSPSASVGDSSRVAISRPSRVRFASSSVHRKPCMISL
jgi:tetratricopeptide (TPR) repeat protein